MKRANTHGVHHVYSDNPSPKNKNIKDVPKVMDETEAGDRAGHFQSK